MRLLNYMFVTAAIAVDAAILVTSAALGVLVHDAFFLVTILTGVGTFALAAWHHRRSEERDAAKLRHPARAVGRARVYYPAGSVHLAPDAYRYGIYPTLPTQRTGER